MARYSPKQLKAIGYEMQRQDSIVQLSLYPMVTFMRKSNGEKYDKHVNNLVNDFDLAKKEEAAERIRLAKENERKEASKAYMKS